MPAQLEHAHEKNQKNSRNRITESFFASLSHSRHCHLPYDYWLLEHTLPLDVVKAIVDMPFDAPDNMNYNGKREANNSKRVYFSKENQNKIPVCRELVEAFDSKEVKEAIEKKTGADLSQGLLRIEYCQDTNGFWLEPHTDISVKKFTMLVYLCDDPALANTGTDIYEGPPDFKWVGCAPYAFNKSLIFIPGKNTWHGFEKKTIKGIRKSIIINYVSPEWRATEELAY